MIHSRNIRALTMTLGVAAITACAGTGADRDEARANAAQHNEHDTVAGTHHKTSAEAAATQDHAGNVSAGETARQDTLASVSEYEAAMQDESAAAPAGERKPKMLPPGSRRDRTESTTKESFSLPMSIDAVGNAEPSAVAPQVQHYAARAACCPLAPTEQINRENYAQIDANPVRLASEHPVSTFSVDVDTGAYANVRRFLTQGQLPPTDAVRVEELINYFSYAYPTPANTEVPFTVVTELAPTPWNEDTMLLHVGLKGFEVAADQRPPANLVFLVDVSGSMQSPDKLPLLQDALRMLTRHLDERDTVSIAGYAGGAGLILEPTSGAHKREIAGALGSLKAAGRTNGAAGIHLAYELAERGFIDGGINRVIIATDGDFNVGTVNFEALIDLIENKREHGVALTALGFGSGNYNDHLLEQIADAGNGNYAYIDNQREARKVLVEEMSSTLQTIAKDVKIQIEFNPDVVAEYRLVGYENRMLRREDFNNDKIDAGEIGAGHTVTALYEVTLIDSPARLVDPLRYGGDKSRGNAQDSELAFVKLRFKQPDAEASTLIERAVTRRMLRDMKPDFQFAAAVAAFGQRLRGGDYLGSFDYEQIAALAADAIGRDPHGYRGEFIGLVEQAAMLSEPLAATRVRDDRLHVAQ